MYMSTISSNQGQVQPTILNNPLGETVLWVDPLIIRCTSSRGLLDKLVNHNHKTRNKCLHACIINRRKAASSGIILVIGINIYIRAEDLILVFTYQR
jgi:hypothetical protein